MSQQPESPRPVRLVVPATTSARIDAVMVEVAYRAGTKVTKADLTDALLQVGLEHLDEAAEKIKQGSGQQ